MTYSAALQINGQSYTYPGTSTLPGYSIHFNANEIEGKFGVMAPAAGKPVPITPSDLGAHTVDIFNNGALVKTLSIARMQWLGGWRFDITPDTIKTTPAQLLAANLLPPYAIVDLVPGRTAPPKAGDSDYTPGGAYGLTRYMPNTGERPDIGMLTDRQADAILHNADQASFDNLVLEARGFDSMPIWQYDSGGVVWDMATHYTDCTNPQAGAQFFIGSGSPDPSPISPTRWYLDAAHNPRWPYLLYMMTQETRYLRIGQFYTNHWLMSDNSWSRKAGYLVIGQGQDRAYAWVLNDLVCVCLATKAEEAKCAAQGIPFPADLRPYSYWKTILDNQAKWLTATYLNTTSAKRFGVFPVQGWISPWQQDHVNNTILFAARNFPEWIPAATLLAKNVLARTSGKSGWAPAHPSSYRLPLGVATVFKEGQTWGTGSPAAVKDTDLFSGWPEVWSNYAALCNTPAGFANMSQANIQRLLADPFNGGNWLGWDKGSPCFTVEALAQLVDLQRKGILDIDGAYPGEDLEATYALQHAYLKKQGIMAPRWSIAVQPKGSVVIPPVPPPQPIPVPTPVPAPPPPPPPPVPVPVPPPPVSAQTKLDMLIADIQAAIVKAKGP